MAATPITPAYILYPTVVLFERTRLVAAAAPDTGPEFSGVGGLDRAAIEIVVFGVSGKQDAELHVQLEHSDDGLAWSALGDDHVFTERTKLIYEQAISKDYLRVAWDKDGNFRSAQLVVVLRRGLIDVT
jgi:hypothetical protein